MTINYDRQTRLLAEPSNRRVIAVVDPLTYAKVDYDDKIRAHFNSPGVMVLPTTYDLTTSPMLLALGRRGMWEEDAVLTQNPYHTEMYEDDEAPYQHFVQSKVRLIAEVVQKLGAETFSYSEQQDSSQTDNLGVRGGAGRGPVRGEASLDRDTAESIRRGLQIDYTWAGDQPDVEGARTLLHRHNLLGDDSLSSLINLRESSHNRHQSMVEQFDMLRESSSTIDLAGKIRAGLNNVELGSKRRKTTRAKLTVTFRVTYAGVKKQGRS